MDKESITNWFKELQDNICNSLEEIDGKSKFQEDQWKREEGGGGRTRLISDGNVFEKGGVNFSAVHGPTPEKILQALNLKEANFYATGVSIVIHPESPFVPIIHMNVRYFEMSDGTWWFGGGIDLTPHYVASKDAAFFHSQLKKTCDAHHPDYYSKFKNWADDYFYIKHREETRGIGGIFFDRLSDQDGHTKESRFNFVKDVGLTFAPTYGEIVSRNRGKDYSESEKTWQFLRRGRYAEFNLVYDKGTKFGLDTGGRTESILMSLPPQANWVYDYQPEKGTKEYDTQSFLKKGIDWINHP